MIKKNSLSDKLIMNSIGFVSEFIAFWYKIIMVDILSLASRIYKPLIFNYREVKLDKGIIYGGPTLEELTEKYWEYEASKIDLKNFDSFLKKIESAFIYEAVKRGWIPKLKPIHDTAMDPIQLKTAVGRRTMAIQFSSAKKISSIGVARGGLRYGIASDKKVDSYINGDGVCKTLYELYGDKTKLYEETENIVIK